MPDQNKLKKAKQIHLRMVRCCGNCTQRDKPPDERHAHCEFHSFMHEKHERETPMPAFRFFVCDEHDLDEWLMNEETGWYAQQEWSQK